MTFTGNIPRNIYSRLMKSDIGRLIDGTIAAARMSSDTSELVTAKPAILVSCVGRKLVLKQRSIEEEVEGMCDILGKKRLIKNFIPMARYQHLTENVSANCITRP